MPGTGLLKCGTEIPTAAKMLAMWTPLTRGTPHGEDPVLYKREGMAAVPRRGEGEKETSEPE